MRIAYFDCTSGIAGDMTVAALIDAGVDLTAIQDGVASLGLPDCRLSTSEVTKRGFRATQFDVEYEPEHVHRHLDDIFELVDCGNLTPLARGLARRIFYRLAEAEAKVHGTTVDRVHFHEVGAVDSIADVVAAAIGLDLLGVDRIICSPIPTGTGTIEIAHGRVSIPAPATAELLRQAGVPLAESHTKGELTTPTGAAIVTTISGSYGPMPAMQIEKIGYGAGHADFDQPNILRLLVGETVDQSTDAMTPSITESICLLETNIDDVTGELLGHCADRLWRAGAFDVTMAPIQMKKGRPGTAITVQCRPSDADTLESILFSETTTFGIRRSHVERRILARRSHEAETPWGKITGTLATLPDGSTRFSPDYECCRRIADEQSIALPDVYAAAMGSE